ncbi:hypothetical protein G7Y89_g4615 [Cudoniella acicularis]|uniref:Uncharacterized protein n=1 Tax=Cudoniella acicularis TaxID=354080 RepID=A0A8H4RR96_9HELO|nr:hypothetical protein G7Y89_g4615 [Cudoniella acicularis]
MPVIWKLQMPRKQKTAVSDIFLLGAFVIDSWRGRFTLRFGSSNASSTLYGQAKDEKNLEVSSAKLTRDSLKAGIESSIDAIPLRDLEAGAMNNKTGILVQKTFAHIDEKSS